MMTRTLHVGFIMDGNGRWAERRGLPRSSGHKAGVKAVRRIVECAPEMGIGVMTIYAFSADNWSRPAMEVNSLMKLLQLFLNSETKQCKAQGVRIEFVGRRDRLPQNLLQAIIDAEQSTINCTGLHLRIAVDYSSRDALVEAARKMAGENIFTRESMSRCLASPDMDLVVRTASEKRLSDFFLWEAAYAELYFCDVLWPDFDRDHLAQAISEFHNRTRKFGGLAKLAS